MGKTPSQVDLDALSPIAWVIEERRRQVEARGHQRHSPYKYFAILSEEMGEVAKVLEYGQEGKLSSEEYVRELSYELIQVSAVAVGFIEAIRSGEGTAALPVCTCPACPGISAPDPSKAAV